MGTLKDIVDLTSQLANSVQDRKIATELNTIQQLILNLQSEQAILHETNIELREERLTLKEKVQELETELKELKTKPSNSIDTDAPKCPNCSTKSSPFYLRSVPARFVKMMGVTHECPKCKYNTNIKK